jgi:chemotaxis protein CheZ
MSPQPQLKEFSVERQLRRQRFQRPEGVSNADILETLEELRQEIRNAALAPGAGGAVATAEDGAPTAEALAARVEIAAMVRMIGKAKMEIASIRHPKADDDRMNAATSELDAIVLATETSTQDVLSSSEQIEILVRQMTGLHPDDEEMAGIAEQVAEEIIKIFEACSFQDITGQRITKVIRTIRYIEERILAMINIWGVEAFAELPMVESDMREGDKALMNGPQLPNQGISQDDINALFD